jgi:hypothetical protein
MDYEISSMEQTRGIIIERIAHPERGQFPSYEAAKKVADLIGDNYFPWPV